MKSIHLKAGIGLMTVVFDGGLAKVVPPSLNFMRGWTEKKVRDYAHGKRWEVLALALFMCMGNTRCTKQEPPPVCTPGTDVQFAERVRYVPIEASLTAKITDTSGDIAASTTNNEAVATARSAKALLAQCNARLSDIELIQGSDKP